MGHFITAWQTSISGLSLGHNIVSIGQSFTAVPKYMTRESLTFGTIAKRLKAIFISFVMPFCSSLVGQLGFHWWDFHEILIFENFYETC